MINYNEIINNISTERVEQILQKLHISYIDKGDYLLMRTVCHHADENEASEKLYYYKDNHFFMCYSECSGQNILTFLNNYYEVRGITKSFHELMDIIIDKAIDIEQGFETFRYQKDQRFNKKQQIILPEYNNGVLGVFSKQYPTEWIKEGITTTTMDKYNILYSISQNKIIIPHYDINNRLVGIRGRALDPIEAQNGKYKPVYIENKLYSHPLSLNLYGLNFTKDYITNSRTAIIFESEKSVMMMDSYFPNDNNSVAVCGSNFNKNQLLILLRNCKIDNIILAFDKEYQKKNTEESSKYFEKLRSIGRKYNKYCNFYYICDRENLLNYKDSPIDRGPEIFNYLLSKKIEIKG